MPFTWARLTDDQRKVARSIHAWLVDYLSESPEPGPSGNESLLGWSLDQGRHSNVLLIDGGRGSGKTSVMLSMLDLWKKLFEESPDLASSDWNDLQPELKKINGCLIPVAVLDLQPIPPSTSLRTWIAGRLVTLAQSAEAHQNVTKESIAKKALWTPASEHEAPWRRAWRKLLNDAAAGWHDSGMDRGKIDPESLAVELEEAELARSSIVTHWRAFVDEVVNAVSEARPHTRPNARIVIPIDDADMNPRRCVELLELLRTLWHPRVVFLLTGHSDLFLKTLTLHFLGVFRAQLGGSSTTDLERSILEDREPTANDLALQTYDKVLPARQRFALNTLLPAERLRFLSDVFDARLSTKAWPSSFSTLRDYFEHNPYVHLALPDRLRGLQSLRQRWNPHRAEQEGIATLAHEMWHEALVTERYRLLTEHALWLESLVGLEDGHLQIRNTDWRIQRRPSKAVQLQIKESKHSLEFMEAAGFECVLPFLGQSNKLPPRLNAALLMIVDIWLKDWGESFGQSSIMPRGHEHALIASRPAVFEENRIIADTFLQPGQPASSATFTTWLLPDFRTVLDFAIFDKHWNAALKRRSESREQRVDSMAYAFLWSVLSTAEIKQAKAPPPSENIQDWSAIAADLVDATSHLHQSPRRTDREERLYQWLLGRAILLTVPESGMFPKSANALLEAWLTRIEHEPAPLKQDAIQAARDERQAQLSRIDRQYKSSHEVRFEIDAAFPSHGWARLLEMRDATKDMSIQKLLGNELSSLSVDGRRRTNSNIRNVRDYADALDLRIPVTPSFVAQSREALERIREMGSRTHSAILWLWNRLVDEFEPENRSLRKWITPTDAGGKLDVRLSSELRERLHSFGILQTRVEKNVALEPSGMSLYLYQVTTPKPADALRQFLSLAHDVVFDSQDTHARPLDSSPPNAEAFIPIPHADTEVLYGGKLVRMGWPAPRWRTFVDWKIETQSLTDSFDVLKTLLEHDSSFRFSKLLHASCLDIVLQVSQNAIQSMKTQIQADALSQGVSHWFYVGLSLRSKQPSADVALQGESALLFARWTRWAAPLFATPELGLAPEYARAMLAGLLGVDRNQFEGNPGLALPSHGGDLSSGFRKMRREWARYCLNTSGEQLKNTNPRLFLQAVDLKHQNHPWHEAFGKDSADPS
ncbi:hypothetical protein [Corallococcus sp. CA049B]|uniref:hypothetical protein n=1 Tax=Corallococcus sp. CA049B TaxID=2316730 RepID=UPI0011C473E2|nr:hypothetical protein [Corallococcus sp. CA049B]